MKTAPHRRHRQSLLRSSIGLAVAALRPSLRAQTVKPPAPIKAVASFSILGDLVQQVGSDRVALWVLVSSGGDAQGPAATYINTMRHNTPPFTQTLQGH